MSNRNLDIFLTFFFTALTIVLFFSHLNTGGVLTILGFLLVFVLPGYTLSVALFPEISWSNMERFVFTLGLSLVLSILGGIFLYYFAIPLRGETWVLFFCVMILSTGLIGIFRRFRLAKFPVRRRESDTAPVVYKLVYPTPAHLFLFGLSAIIILGAIIFSRKIAETQPATEIVQLWILHGNSIDIPSVEIGVRVNEFAPHEFSLLLERDGYIIQSWPRLILESGVDWRVVVPLDVHLPGTGPLEVYLYSKDQPNIPYRYGLLWPEQIINR